MIAVILAAGMASRLRPLTDHSPKCLLKVGGGRSLLQRTVDALLDAGMTELVVVTGYRGEMIEDFLARQYPSLAVHLIDNPDYQTTNNIYSLYLAKPCVEGREFTLLDSDILFDPAILPLVMQPSGSTIAVNRHELGEEEMKVVTDAEGHIVEISKTCDPSLAAGESVGIEKISATYSRALFAELDDMMCDEALRNTFYELAFQRLIAKGHSFRIIDTTAVFSMELDTVDDFTHAQSLIPSHIF